MRHAFLVIVSAFCSVALAQTPPPPPPPAQEPGIYRSVMPDGRIVFGDKPAPGAKESKLMVLRPANVAPGGVPSAPAARQSQGGAPSQQNTIQAANADLNEARQNLERARATLESNRQPRPEEQVGIVRSGKGGTGGMRTNEAYEQRIKALEEDVATAQRQLEEAQARRNEAR